MNRTLAFDQHTRIDPRFTADEFLVMSENGAFDDVLVELVGGELRRMSPPNFGHSEFHATATSLINSAKPSASCLLVEASVKLDDRSVRVIDVALADPNFDRARTLAPSDILLAVEIADTTLSRDLGGKLEDYAAAGIQHYWVVDLKTRVVHVMHDPIGADYAAREVVRFGEPLFIPGSNQPITFD